MILLRFGLWILSLLYALIVTFRNVLFDFGIKRVIKVPVPVISVGNITTGGTGKTPMVAWIAKWLRDRDQRVTLLSRGYGGIDGGPNDEALELYRRLPDVPHLQNPDRVTSALMAIEELEAEVLVLDDGFQHRRLGRNLEIVLIDATCPFGFGYVLPRGLMREPKRGLRRADLIVITRIANVDTEYATQLENRITAICGDTPTIKVSHEPTRLVNSSGNHLPLVSLQGRRIVTFCAIGNPTAFENSIQSIGAQIVESRQFPDHHVFTQDDIDSLESMMDDGDAEMLICTCKDLVKVGIDRIGDHEIWALEIEVVLQSGEDTLNAMLEQTVGINKLLQSAEVNDG